LRAGVENHFIVCHLIKAAGAIGCIGRKFRCDHQVAGQEDVATILAGDGFDLAGGVGKVMLAE